MHFCNFYKLSIIQRTRNLMLYFSLGKRINRYNLKLIYIDNKLSFISHCICES